MTETIRVPWLHDRHSHASLYASLTGCESLAGRSTAESLAVLRALDPARLSLVFGWHSATTPLNLRDLAGLPPAIIVNLSMHGYALTDSAIPMLAEDQPEMVRFRNDSAWGERHLPQLLEFFCRTAGLTPLKLAGFMRSVEKLGLGSVDDMLLPGEEAFQVIRLSPWGTRIQCWTTPTTFLTLSPETQKAVAGLKLFTDGALGSRTAALRGSYLGGSDGLLLYRDEDLLQCLGDCHAHRKPLAIHAIGDRAIEQALTVLERLHGDGVTFPRVRLEHVQFIDEVQARRAKALGLTLSMQPNFSSDSQDYADRLDARWLERNNPFRMLIDQVGFKPGEDLIFGSDGMPHGVENALQWSLFPRFPDQRLTIDEVISGYGVHQEGHGHSVLAIDEAERRVRLLESKAE